MTTSEKLQTTKTRYACRLTDVEDVKCCGAKAFNLAIMLRHGLCVPPGFVVTNQAFQEFLDHNNLREPISQLCDNIDTTNPDSVHRTSREIRARVITGEIPAHLLESISERQREMPADITVVVRSSAVGEDSQQASFAGQLDSFLDIDSPAAFSDALLACWASYWSERSLFYQRSRNIHLQGMGVLVQQQVESKIAGVLFTRNPDPALGDRDTMLAEYCSGYGVALVSGQINPGRLSITRAEFAWKLLAVPEGQDGPHGEVPIDETLISQLANAGVALEQLFGGPQDIEWTVDENGKFHLLQSRPIAVSSAQGIAGHDGKMILWSNDNVNENYPDPISPLLYSIAADGYYHYFRNLGTAFGIDQSRVRAMEYDLRHIIGVHGARMYYNLTSIHACLRMAPWGDALTESFNSFVGATRTAETSDPVSGSELRRGRLSEFLAFCRIARKATWQFLFLSKRVAKFERTVDEFAAGTVPASLEEKSLAELLDDLRAFLEIRCHRWTNASLADAATMLSYGMLKRLLNREYPDKDHSALHNTLLKGLPNLVSNLPVTRLWDLSREIRGDVRLTEIFADNDATQILNQLQQTECDAFREQLDDYLDQFGFRCSGELMLTVPSFQENPAALVEILQAYSHLESDSPIDRLMQQDAQRSIETKRVLRELKRRKLWRFLPWPGTAFLTKRLLKWTQSSIALRERARLKQALLYTRCRRIVLAIGSHLVSTGDMDDCQDIFFLTHQEIEDLLSGTSMFPGQVRELINQRKTAHVRLSQMTPPDTFELPAGTHWSCETDNEQISQAEAQAEGGGTPTQENVTEWNGVGACGGTATGPAAILKDVSEFHLLTAGDILVTRQTDPGWGPMFFLIKGLVIERGGMLSHGAILAREYGIPTVVGVQDATRQITHGQTLTVNGDRGVVHCAR